MAYRPAKSQDADRRILRFVIGPVAAPDVEAELGVASGFREGVRRRARFIFRLDEVQMVDGFWRSLAAALGTWASANRAASGGRRDGLRRAWLRRRPKRWVSTWVASSKRLEAIRRALETAGVEFTNGGQPGVSLV